MDILPAEDRLTDHYPQCFGCGFENPSSMRIAGRLDGLRITAKWMPPDFAVGGPGIVHGGCLAAAVDEIQALLASAMAGVPAMTAKVEVNYLAPVLIGRQLLLGAQVAERRGRKLVLTMTATDESTGTVCFEGSGIYVAVSQDKWIDQMDRQGIDFKRLDLLGGDASKVFGWQVQWLRENFRPVAEPVPTTVAVELDDLRPSQWIFALSADALRIESTDEAPAIADATIGPIPFSVWQSMLEQRVGWGDLLRMGGYPLAGDSAAVDELFRQLPEGRMENPK